MNSICNWSNKPMIIRMPKVYNGAGNCSVKRWIWPSTVIVWWIFSISDLSIILSSIGQISRFTRTLHRHPDQCRTEHARSSDLDLCESVSETLRKNSSDGTEERPSQTHVRRDRIIQGEPLLGFVCLFVSRRSSNRTLIEYFFDLVNYCGSRFDLMTNTCS